MGDMGLEHSPLALSKTAISAESGAKSHAHDAPSPIHDPDLTRIVAVWQQLPEHIKAAVMALVQSASKQGEETPDMTVTAIEEADSVTSTDQDDIEDAGMGKEEQKRRFALMRAKGYSHARIGRKLRVSKGTLPAWNTELEEEIARVRAIELEALQEEFFLLKEGRIRLIGEQLKAIQTEISKRDLSKVNTDTLLELQLRYFNELKGEYVEAGRRTKKLEFEYSLGYVIEERFYAIAPPEARREIEKAGGGVESVADFAAAVPEAHTSLCKQAIDQIHRLHTSGKLPAVYHEEDAKEVEALLGKWEKEGLSYEEVTSLLDALYVTGRQLYECEELPEWKRFIEQYQRHWLADADERFGHAYAVLEDCPHAWLDKKGNYKEPSKPSEWITRGTELLLGPIDHHNESRHGRLACMGHYLALDRRRQKLMEGMTRWTYRGVPTRKAQRLRVLEARLAAYGRAHYSDLV
jgi:hypothetical protein